MTVISEFQIPSAFTRLIEEPTKLFGVAIATIALLCVLSYAQGNGLADGFDTIGMKRNSVILLPAKVTFFRKGADMMYAAMARLEKAFYVCSMEGPVSYETVSIVSKIRINKL